MKTCNTSPDTNTLHGLRKREAGKSKKRRIKGKEKRKKGQERKVENQMFRSEKQILKDAGLFEVRFHGRGGQGMVTASYIIGDALVRDGFFVQAFPEFGPERRGAPVRAYLRFSKSPIFRRDPIRRPDFLVIADPSLITLQDTWEGADSDTTVIINGDENTAHDVKAKGFVRVFFVRATEIALHVLKKPIFNVAIVGAFARVLGFPSLQSLSDSVLRFVRDRKNIEVMRRAYENTEEV